MNLIAAALGWIALMGFAFCVAAMFYAYYGAKAVVRRAAAVQASGAEGLDESAASARARIKWIRTNQSRLPEDVARAAERVLIADRVSTLAFAVVVAMWVLSMFLGK